jgi:hypothetical protein
LADAEPALTNRMRALEELSYVSAPPVDRVMATPPFVSNGDA